MVMGTRSGIRSVVATVLGAVMLADCSTPGPAPIPSSAVTTTSAPTATTSATAAMTSATPASGLPIAGTGFGLHAPAGYVDVTERAAKAVLGWPVFGDKSLTLVWVGVEESDPGNLSRALVVAVLAGGPDPATAAAALTREAGASGAPSSVAVAGQTWHTFPTATGASAQAGLGALCRFAETNVVLVEAGSGSQLGAHPTLWSVAATLSRP